MINPISRSHRADTSPCTLALFVVFGFLTGLLGIAYNRLILGLLDIVARLDKIPRLSSAQRSAPSSA